MHNWQTFSILSLTRVKRTVQGPSGHIVHKKGHSRHCSDPAGGLGFEYDDMYLKGTIFLLDCVFTLIIIVNVYICGQRIKLFH